MEQKGFTLVEVILGLAIFVLMVGVIARNVVSVNDLYKEGQLTKDLTALGEAIKNYYTAQGNFPGNINDLSAYMPTGWQNENPFGYDGGYSISFTGAVARIETRIPDTINHTYLPNTYTYTNGGTKYARSEIITPRENFNAQWERKYVYETTHEVPQQP